jgi:hypothetical protein
VVSNFATRDPAAVDRRSGPGLQRTGAFVHPLDENPDAGALPLEFSTKANARVEERGYGHPISGIAYADSTILKERRDA